MDSEAPVPLLDATEVARQLDVSEKTLTRMVRQGRAPDYVIVNRTPKWRQADINRFLEESVVSGRKPSPIGLRRRVNNSHPPVRGGSGRYARPVAPTDTHGMLEAGEPADTLPRVKRGRPTNASRKDATP